MAMLILSLVLFVVVTAFSSSVPAQAQDEECPWMDTSLSADQRARLLLDASTLEQKMRWLVEPAANNPYETDIGGFGGSATYPLQVPCAPFIQYTDSPIAVTSRGVTGLFDHPLPEERVPDVSTPANQAVAQRVAEEGSVLLKNEDGILPLDGDAITTIAVMGATASATPTDGVSAETVCGPRAPQADCSNVEAPLDGITARAAMDGISVVFDNGSDLGSAASTAASADVA